MTNGRGWKAGILALALGGPLQAAPVGYQVAPGSKVGFYASASVHNFVGNTEAVRGKVVFDFDAPETGTGEVVLASDELRTGNSGRDKDMRQKALETAKYPEIKMTMTRFVPHGPRTEAGALEGNIHGELELHGTKGKLAIPATVEKAAGGRLKVTGKVGIDMVDWGIRPPRQRILFVNMAVLPNVTVFFELALEPTAEVPSLMPPGEGGTAPTRSAAELLEAMRKAREARTGAVEGKGEPAPVP